MRVDEIGLTVADELDDATLVALREAGVTESSLELLKQGDPGALLFSQAVLTARTLECSLYYLMRTTSERGRPPDDGIRFGHIAYTSRRKEVGLAAERVRDVLGLSPRDGRRLALGTFEPTVGQITVLETALLLPPGGLLEGVYDRT